MNSTYLKHHSTATTCILGSKTSTVLSKYHTLLHILIHWGGTFEPLRIDNESATHNYHAYI